MRVRQPQTDEFCIAYNTIKSDELKEHIRIYGKIIFCQDKALNYDRAL
ncbi:MAG: hypothetical protein U9O87_03145 [Verrucomicrobiota bacterium]|nr:hypothetical protein [Verrucomicrobiota bacterium]